jgi:3-keto steroid reductase
MILSGVGYGICERLLEQLCYVSPPDLEPQFRNLLDTAAIDQLPLNPPAEGLTLVLACRSMSRADAARKSLLKDLDERMADQRRRLGPNPHAERFRANLRIEMQYIDMALMSSVFNAAAELCQKCLLSGKPLSLTNDVSVGTRISLTLFATRVSRASPASTGG